MQGPILTWGRHRLDKRRGAGEIGAMRFVLAIVVLLAAAAPADAGFSVCNKSAQPIIVSLGRFNGHYWSSQGWWSLAPSGCSELVSGRLKSRYYYLYATDGAFSSWEGSTEFCVGLIGNFTDVQRGNCAKRGLDRRKFFQVDTGNQIDWTQNISNQN